MSLTIGNLNFLLAVGVMIVTRSNIVSNVVGGVAIALLTIIVTPILINTLGIASYGVIGFIAMLQVILTALDLGLASTMTREVAADDSAGKQKSIELVRSVSTIFWLLAAATWFGMAWCSEPIATRWFVDANIRNSELRECLEVASLYLALRWPVALYSAVLTGLQRMDILNFIKVVAVCFRLLGGIVVLLYVKTLHAFIVWTTFSSLFEVAAFWLACSSVWPSMARSPGISWKTLRIVWRYAASVWGIGLITIIVVQADRLAISTVLTLEEFGVYSLAYSMASATASLIGAIAIAVLPSFAATYGSKPLDVLIRDYDRAVRATLFVSGLLVGTFVFFGEWLVKLWVNPKIAELAGGPLAVLAIGFWLSAVVSNAYQIALAAGRPDLVLRISGLSAPIYILVLVFMTIAWGIEGAAFAWVLLNLLYVVTLIPAVHKQILQASIQSTAFGVILPFALLTVFAFGLPSYLPSLAGNSNTINMAGISLAVMLYVTLGSFLIWEEIKGFVPRRFRSWLDSGERL